MNRQYQDGVFVRDGDILAAEFVNAGKAYRAVRYVGPNGRADYYTPDGRPVRKAFLRYPVDYARISSGFSTARFHPVLNRVRAHKGIDFAAPTGTPIKAAGAGRIVSRGRSGGYGNVIVLAHSGGVTTLYGHMSRFAKGLSVGSRVEQGQVIGYVGMTGLATGPHVHYEYRVNGVHKNPAKVTVAKADPIPASLMADFKAQTTPLLARLGCQSAGACADRARTDQRRRYRRPLSKKGTFTIPARIRERPLFLPQVENDDPQPQVVVAFGLRMTNWAPSRSSR